MRGFSLLLTVAAIAVSVDARGAFEGTDKNFKNQVLGSGKNVFVKFLAPW